MYVYYKIDGKIVLIIFIQSSCNPVVRFLTKYVYKLKILNKILFARDENESRIGERTQSIEFLKRFNNYKYLRE